MGDDSARQAPNDDAKGASPKDLWDHSPVPEERTEEFQRRITFNPNYPVYVPENEDYWTWSDPVVSRSHSSFGHKGTTATVSASGQLMQFGSYLDAGKSGMFSADQAGISEPCFYIRRAQNLDELSKVQRPGQGHRFTYGLSTSLDQHDLQHAGSVKYIHGRWPRYEFMSKEVSINVQWTVHKGMVIQQYLAENLTDEPISVDFRFADNLAIRDLDEEDWNYSFNDAYGATQDSENANTINATSQGPNEYAWICMHNWSSQYDGQAIGTVVNIYVNGVAEKWCQDRDSSSAEYKWHRNMQPKKTLQIVTAYKMMHLTSQKEDWTKFVFQASDVQEGLLPDSAFTRLSLSRPELLPANPSGKPQRSEEGIADHIDFLIGRHLEHILSVCAIPVGNEFERSSDQCAIALTCGDMSSHTISISASFFAFRFLLEVLEKLKSITAAPTYARELRDRIEWVCKGHVRWLSNTQRLDSGGFADHYRVNGTILTELESNIDLTDTAFQVIKLANFMKAFPETDEAEIAEELASKVCISWLKTLEGRDKRKKYAWRHADGGGFGIFRLDDHVWLFEALKALETQRIWDHLRRTSPGDTTSRIDPLAERFRSESVLMEVITRFTTRFAGIIESDERSRKPLPRILAVTRSLRDNRVLLHARDTALFYCEKLKELSGERWEQSMKMQGLYEEYEDFDWDNALRYGLAIVMGTCNYSLSRTPPGDSVKNAVEVLIRSANPNGFSAGQLDAEKKPILYTRGGHRDFYFHASFEIPYILIRNAQHIYQIFHEDTPNDHTGIPPAVPDSTEPIASSPSSPHFPEITRVTIIEPRNPYDVFSSQPTKVEKRFVLSDHVFNDKNVVKLEEEWLYNYPSFLEREDDITGMPIIKLCYENDRLDPMARASIMGRSVQSLRRTAWWNAVKFRLDEFLRDQDDVESPSWYDLESLMEAKSWTGLEEFSNVMSQGYTDHTAGEFPFLGHCYSEVIDVGKNESSGTSKNKKGKDKNYRLLFSSDQLWWDLRKPRTATMSKKRLLWLEKPSQESILVAYLGAPEANKKSLAEFFDRHANLETHFNEEVSKTTNVWETEFLVSFYRFVDCRPIETPASVTVGLDPIDLGLSNGKIISRGAIGFRFDGDVFDRYWTCHCIDSVPESEGVPDADLPIPDEDTGSERSWAQRRVLELRLLARIVKQIVRDTDKITSSVKGETDVPPWTALKIHDKMIGAQWQSYEHVMQLIQDNLESSITAITGWEKAERDRPDEGLRWTSKDEKKYRSTIINQRITLRKRIEELRLAQSRAISLKKTLASTKARIQSDQEFQGSENLRYFTYVTVVFLPLGFATSIYSMNGYPDGGLLQSMAICAIVALLITLLTLFNAKPLASIFHNWSTFSSTTKKKSYLNSQQSETLRTLSRPIMASQDLELAWNQPQNQKPGGRTDQAGLQMAVLQIEDSKKAVLKTWPLWFWLAYLFLELPARQVLMAYMVLKRGRPRNETSGNYVIFLAKLARSLVQVVSGIVFLPLFIASWVLRLLCFNIMDILSLLGRSIWRTFIFGEKEEMGEYDKRIQQILSPEKLRPLRSRTAVIP